MLCYALNFSLPLVSGGLYTLGNPNKLEIVSSAAIRFLLSARSSRSNPLSSIRVLKLCLSASHLQLSVERD